MVAPTSSASRRYSFTSGVQHRTGDSKHSLAPAASGHTHDTHTPALFVDTEDDTSSKIAIAPPQRSGKPTLPWATMDAKSFLLAHRDLLTRMAADPDWSDAPTQQPQERPSPALGAVEVFGFYDALTKPSRPVEPDRADGDHVLRTAVIQERLRVHEAPHLKAAQALDANLRRVEQILNKREVAWAHQNDAHTVRRRLQSIAASDQPTHVKTAGLLALATAKPAALMDAPTLHTVHQTLIDTLAADPEWRAVADASARHSAPEPGTIFRFYESLRQHMQTQLTAGDLAACDALRTTLALHASQMQMLGLMGSDALSAQLLSLSKALGEASKVAVLRF